MITHVDGIGIGAGHQEFSVFIQRQNTVVFQQYHAFFSNFQGQRAMRSGRDHRFVPRLDFRHLADQRA